MSDLLPLFPLPNVVLFPNVFLPLHVFEPRYRQMVGDALASDRMIGMVLLKPGWEGDYDGQPPIYPIGSSGVITHADRLPDGRYNIVLRGLDRFRVLDEDHTLSYRRGIVQPLDEEPSGAADAPRMRHVRTRLEALLAPLENGPKIPEGMADRDLINALAQYLDLEPVEKQALLEAPTLRHRADSLVDLLEMKMLATRHAWLPNLAH